MYILVLSSILIDILLTIFYHLFLIILQKPNKDASDRQAALCIFDDVVEHCGQAASGLFQHFLNTAVQCIADPGNIDQSIYPSIHRNKQTLLIRRYLPNIISFLQLLDPAVRQAAVYGMGVYAEAGGEVIAPAIPGNLYLNHLFFLAPSDFPHK